MTTMQTKPATAVILRDRATATTNMEREIREHAERGVRSIAGPDAVVNRGDLRVAAQVLTLDRIAATAKQMRAAATVLEQATTRIENDKSFIALAVLSDDNIIASTNRRERDNLDALLHGAIWRLEDARRRLREVGEPGHAYWMMTGGMSALREGGR